MMEGSVIPTPVGKDLVGKVMMWGMFPCDSPGDKKRKTQERDDRR